MKDKHNVILILVSSKWLIPYSGDSSKFLISFVHLSFHRWFNLSNFHPGVSQQFGGVSHRHSQILKTEEEFLLNLVPFSSRFAILACCHPLIIIFDCENPFSPIRRYSRVFSVRLSGAHHFRRLVHSQLSALVPQISPVHHSIFFNQRVISSFQLYLNSLKYLRSFSNPSRCFFIFSSFIFNSYGGSFKSSLPWLSYQFIRCFNPSSGSLKTFSRLCYIYLNPFYENK